MNNQTEQRPYFNFNAIYINDGGVRGVIVGGMPVGEELEVEQNLRRQGYLNLIDLNVVRASATGCLL